MYSKLLRPKQFKLNRILLVGIPQHNSRSRVITNLAYLREMDKQERSCSKRVSTVTKEMDILTETSDPTKKEDVPFPGRGTCDRNLRNMAQYQRLQEVVRAAAWMEGVTGGTGEIHGERRWWRWEIHGRGCCRRKVLGSGD